MARKVIAAFLEKDNIKLISYNIGLSGPAKRTFAGQISFAPDVLRDGFIADSAKFSSQIKIAFSQKDELRQAQEVVLFLPVDKTFIKTIASTDSVDSFIKNLPYFKEELVIDSEVQKKSGLTTYVAFEKKLVEDAQKPFLEVGKKIDAVKSAVTTLANNYPQMGSYFLLVPTEKETTVVVITNGAILEAVIYKNDVFINRLSEFLASKNLTEQRTAYALGIVDTTILEKLRTEKNWQITPLINSDIYDLVATAQFSKNRKFSLPEIKLPGINSKYLILAGAVIIGILLVVLVVKNIGKKTSTPPVVKTPIVEEQKPVEPVFKLTDYPIQIMNGTLVTGEAGKLSTKLEAAGYKVSGTKNATSAGFLATRLRVSNGIPVKFVNDLKEIILKDYDSVTIESLATGSAEIIIGKKK